MNQQMNKQKEEYLINGQIPEYNYLTGERMRKDDNSPEYNTQGHLRQARHASKRISTNNDIANQTIITRNLPNSSKNIDDLRQESKKLNKYLNSENDKVSDLASNIQDAYLHARKQKK